MRLGDVLDKSTYLNISCNVSSLSNNFYPPLGMDSRVSGFIKNVPFDSREWFVQGTENILATGKLFFQIDI